MKPIAFLLATLPFILLSCSPGQKEEEEVNLENMVLNESVEPEWTTGLEEADQVASDALPIPQEQIIAETPDAPIKLDSSDSCR